MVLKHLQGDSNINDILKVSSFHDIMVSVILLLRYMLHILKSN